MTAQALKRGAGLSSAFSNTACEMRPKSVALNNLHAASANTIGRPSEGSPSGPTNSDMLPCTSNSRPAAKAVAIGLFGPPSSNSRLGANRLSLRVVAIGLSARRHRMPREPGESRRHRAAHATRRAGPLRPRSESRSWCSLGVGARRGARSASCSPLRTGSFNPLGVGARRRIGMPGIGPD